MRARHLALLCLAFLAARAASGAACPALLTLVNQLPEGSLMAELISVLGATEKPLGIEALPPLPANVVPGENRPGVPFDGLPTRRLQQDGSATERPFRACPRIYSPVCSTDSRVFANDCLAANADAEVACAGRCPCQVGTAAAAAGVVPSVVSSGGPIDPVMGPCPRVFAPVCGTDGTTYSSSCVAGGMEAVACDGPCPCRRTLAAVVVDTADNVDPDAGANVGAGTADAQVPPGEQGAVYCPMIFAPVCGKDGKTYSNDCMAGVAGAEVRCQGECPCSGSGGGGSGGSGNGAGVCIDQYEPVCGIDGITYTNLCRAQLEGAALECLGECPCLDLVQALELGGGLLLVPTDDALLAEMDALNATDVGEWASDKALLLQLLARHVVLSYNQQGAGAATEPPQPSLEGTPVRTEAGESIELVAANKQNPAYVGTGGAGGQRIGILQTEPGCPGLAAVQIEGVLQGPQVDTLPPIV